MKRMMLVSLALAMIPAAVVWAGALLLEVGKPEANPEAKGLNALLVARTTACHDPSKSKVTASLVRFDGGELRRTPLKVAALQTPGNFAILGAAPAGSVIDLSVTNPEYQNYQPRVLIRADSHGLQWSGIRRFFNTPPTDSDLKSIFGESD